MPLSDQIVQSLTDLQGLVSPVPKTVGWSVDGGPAVEIDFTAVESLGCAVRELRISAPGLQAAPLDALQVWAEAMCQRVTYLLERLGLLEVDAAAQSVLIRSTPPTQDTTGATYYEVLVHSPGSVRVRRFARDANVSERRPLDMEMTREVLLKLVRDVIEAIPAPVDSRDGTV